MWKIYFVSLQDQLTVVYIELWTSMAKWFLAIEKFEEDNSQRPHINLLTNLRIIFIESLGRQVPVCSHSLRSQGDFGILIIKHDLTQPKIKNLHNSITKHNVTRLQVIMNDSLLSWGKIVNCRKQLFHYDLDLCLLQTNTLFQVGTQLRTRTVLQLKHQHIFFLSVNNLHKFSYVLMIQFNLYFSLSQQMFDVVLFTRLGSRLIVGQWHTLQGDHSVLFQVIAFVNLAETSSTQQLQSLVSVYHEWPSLLFIPTSVLFAYKFHPLPVYSYLSFNYLLLLPQTAQFLSHKNLTFWWNSIELLNLRAFSC